MNNITVRYSQKLADMPGIERYLDELPVFATQEYAAYFKETQNYSTIWFYSIVNSDIQFIIPFTFRNRFIFKIGTLLTSSIHLDQNIDIENERNFLNSVVATIKQKKLCDWIQQTPNWALFKVVPDNSIFCEFGTYIIDLEKNDEDELLHKMKRDHKQHIRHALSNPAITIRSGSEFLEDCIKVFSLSSSGKNIKLPSKNEIEKFLGHLSDKIRIYISYNFNIPQSAVIYLSDKFNYYDIYAALVTSPPQGINHLLHWQAMLKAQSFGVKHFNFVGSRINPLGGSKQDGIKQFKSHFGGEFVRGYLWKMPILKSKYYLYCCLIKLISVIKLKDFSSDIIDQELKKIESERKQLNFNKRKDFQLKNFPKISDSLMLRLLSEFSTLFIK